MLGNFILETTNSPGTAQSVNLAGAQPGRVAFRARFASGAKCFYVMDDGTQSEAGYGTLTLGTPDTFSRDTVLWNSDGTTTRMNFAGETYIYNTVPAERTPYFDFNGVLNVPNNAGSDPNQGARVNLISGAAKAQGGLDVYSSEIRLVLTDTSKANENPVVRANYAGQITGRGASPDYFVERSDLGLQGQLLPVGSIIMYWGNPANLPANWKICDGTNGTPNLRDRFVIPAGGSFSLGQQGGSTTCGGSTDSQGYHSHGGATAGAGLSEAQLAPHQHAGTTAGAGNHTHGIPSRTLSLNTGGVSAVDVLGPQPATTGAYSATNVGDHAHTFGTDWRGGGQAHAHGIYGDGNHAHNVTVSGWPPFTAVYFIMRIW